MMRVFGEDNAHMPVTVLDLAGCQVVGRRTVNAEEYKNAEGEAVALKPKKSRKNEKTKPPAREAKGDGYNAVQLAAGATKAKNKTAKPSAASSRAPRSSRRRSCANSASAKTICCRSAR